MEKLSDHVKLAKEALRTFEGKLSEAEEKSRNVGQNRAKTEIDLGAARARLINAERCVETVLTEIAGGTATPEHLKAARNAVKKLESEIKDFEAVVSAHGPVELRMKAEVDDLRQRLTTSTKEFWAAVAETLEEKARGVVGDLVRQCLAARELAGWYVSHDTGDHLARIFFARSAPKLEKQRGELLEKYLQ